MSTDKNVSDPSEIRETSEELSSDVTKKDITTTVKYDKTRRLTMIPSSHRHKKSDDNKSSDKGSSNGEPEDEEAFDTFILNNFSPFSGNENVIEWLDITDEKFNTFKMSRKLRYLAIPLLVKGEAKRIYTNNMNKINTYHDFYTLLLMTYKPINYNFQPTKLYSDPPTLSQSNLEDASMRKNVVFDDKSKMTTSNLELNDSLPQPSILRSTALFDLGPTGSSGNDPVNRSNLASSQNTFLNSSILDQTVVNSSPVQELSNRIESLNDQKGAYAEVSDSTNFLCDSTISQVNTVVDFGVTNTIGLKPAKKSMTVSTDPSIIRFDLILNELPQAVIENSMKNPMKLKGGQNYVVQPVQLIKHMLHLVHIPNTNRLRLISYVLQRDVLQCYKSNSSTYISPKIFLYKKRKKNQLLNTNAYGKNSYIKWLRIYPYEHSFS